MRHLLYDGNPGMGIPLSHLLHFADANDAEIEVNGQFLDSIEFMFGPHTTMSIENSANIFLDFITEGRKFDDLKLAISHRLFQIWVSLFAIYSHEFQSNIGHFHISITVRVLFVMKLVLHI
jgi:hypothetical protein